MTIITEGQTRTVNVWPDNPADRATELKYRFQWNFPFSSPARSQCNVRCQQRAASFHERRTIVREDISGILTRNDKSKQVSSGGPRTKDNTSVEYFSTIFTVLIAGEEERALDGIR
ncbi:MAG: hypothetical protein U0R19_18075 [Bryobacteraceae bacterium]